MRAVVGCVSTHTSEHLSDMSRGFLIKSTCFNKEGVLGNSLIRLIFELLL